MRHADLKIQIHAGERYAGIMLDENSGRAYHLILLPGDAYKLDWNSANNFAEESGGQLPTRREHYLLYANLKSQFLEYVYWSSEQYQDNSDYAWGHSYNGGEQGYYHVNGELRARAVRRIPVTNDSGLSVMLLASSRNSNSNLYSLIYQASAEGHDVNDALAEANALHDGIRIADKALEDISLIAVHARGWSNQQ